MKTSHTHKDSVRPHMAASSERNLVVSSQDQVEQELDFTGAQETTFGLFGERTVSTGELSKSARRKRLRQILKVVRRYKVVRGLTPSQLVSLLEDLGPTFVKAGQILSMRSEILPPQFCKELETLRTDVEPLPFDVVTEVLCAEYAGPLNEIFAYIDPVPLGSASIAQVHRGKLISGQDVAIKVQRPRVKETMAQDIEIMRGLSARLKPLIKNSALDLDGVIDELWESFQVETDFLKEAQNMQEFLDNNADVKYVTAPKPYPEITTQHVLVMDYVDGKTISHPQEIEAEGYDLVEIGTKLVENYTKQVLDDGFFHVDPHPGNIMIAQNKIVWIDWGMVGTLDKRYQEALTNMMIAVASQDTPLLKRCLLDVAVLKEDRDQLDHGALLADLDAIVATYGTQDLQELDLGAFLSELMALAHRYGLELPGALTMIARGLITLEGVLDEFIPDVSMVEIIQAHITRSQDLGAHLEEELKRFVQDSSKATKGALEGLSQLGVIAQMLTRGQLKMNLDFAGSDDPIEDLSHVADSLALAIIIAGLFIGSSILYFAGSQFTIFGIPLLGFIGFLVAFVLSLYTAHDILRHRRNRR